MTPIEITLVVLFIIEQVIDFVATEILLRRYQYRELNPVYAALRGKVVYAVLVKAIAVGAFVGAALVLDTAFIIVGCVLVLFFAWANVHNLRLLHQRAHG